MQLNPIPYVLHSNYYEPPLFLLAFVLLPAVAFITGSAISLKNTSERKLIGAIFIVAGTMELLLFLLFIVTYANQTTMKFLLVNPFTFLSILGLITIAGGVASIKKAKAIWIWLLIIAAIILVIGMFIVYYVMWGSIVSVM